MDRRNWNDRIDGLDRGDRLDRVDRVERLLGANPAEGTDRSRSEARSPARALSEGSMSNDS